MSNKREYILGTMYGLAPMSLRQEAAAPDAVRQTRNNKVRIVEDCDAIIQLAIQNKGRARRVPEENDAAHADLVQQYSDAIHKARMALLDCLLMGQE